MPVNGKEPRYIARVAWLLATRISPDVRSFNASVKKYVPPRVFIITKAAPLINPGCEQPGYACWVLMNIFLVENKDLPQRFVTLRNIK
ncbi:hypothetical protein Lcin_1592, partial [Legionella cincinnatiensis]